MSREELEKSIANTTALMKQAAKDLDFMQAAQYRDESSDCKRNWKKKRISGVYKTDRTAPREPEAGNPPAWY